MQSRKSETGQECVASPGAIAHADRLGGQMEFFTTIQGKNAVAPQGHAHSDGPFSQARSECMSPRQEIASDPFSLVPTLERFRVATHDIGFIEGPECRIPSPHRKSWLLEVQNRRCSAGSS